MPHYVLDARTATPHFPGIGRYIGNLARALVPYLEADEHLTVLEDPQHRVMLPSRQVVSGLRVPVSPFSLQQQWIFPRLLRRIGADLYHSGYYQMPYRLPVPALLTMHDLIPILMPDYSSPPARQLFRLLVRLALRAVQHVLTGSHATQRDLIAHFAIPAERITVVPHAADPLFRPQPSAAVNRLRRKYDLPERFALYVGSNKPHKNLTRLVEAWPAVRAASPHTTLVVAGVWDPRHGEPRQRAQALGLGPAHIRWLGAMPGDDLPPLYSAATLFVFPSLYEGFGLPVIEAMACGIPVACSDVSSLPEVAGTAALLFDPTDTAAIAAALIRLFEDVTLRAEYARFGIEQAGRFSWGKAARETLALYRSTLGVEASQ